MATKSTIRTCKKGHQFYKSSDCPICPICETERKSTEGLFFGLAAPARRALENKGLRSLKELSKFNEKVVLQLHGMGKSSIPVLKNKLDRKILSFKDS